MSNHPGSLNLIRKAAEQGDAGGQVSLGSMYDSGQGGLQQDHAEAAKWYHMAAEQGEEVGWASLGMLHEEGRGVAQDDIEACKWYLLAAAVHNDEARKTYRERLAKLQSRMTPEQIAEAQSRARNWMETKKAK